MINKKKDETVLGEMRKKRKKRGKAKKEQSGMTYTKEEKGKSNTKH